MAGCMSWARLLTTFIHVCRRVTSTAEVRAEEWTRDVTDGTVSAGEGTEVTAARSEKGPAWLHVPCDRG